MHNPLNEDMYQRLQLFTYVHVISTYPKIFATLLMSFVLRITVATVKKDEAQTGESHYHGGDVLCIKLTVFCH